MGPANKNFDDARAETLVKVRSLVSALPEVIERLSHGAPCFYVRRRPLCYFHDAEFSADERSALWCPAPPGDRQHYVQAQPGRYFAPTPSGSGVFSDWIGAYLDGEGADAPDWDEIGTILETAFRHVAPKSLTAQLDASAGGQG